MTDFYALLKKTAAFGVFSAEKREGRLAHAYLIVHPDGGNLLSYLKVFTKTALSASGNPDSGERACVLIENDAHPDVKIYPADRENILVEDVADIINESYIKPIESDKRIFIINRAETMNAAAQNKLLKTLEEPPKNTLIMLGATSEYPLLSTVKSRVRKLFIPEFTGEVLISALKKDCPDEERLKTAVSCGDGTVGKALKNYSDDKLREIIDVACEVITGMKSSKNVLEYSRKISALKCDYIEFFGVLKSLFKDMLVAAENRENLVINPAAYKKTANAEGFSEGAIIYALDKITDAENKLRFNAQEEIVSERLLFQILEGKYKWRKL